MDPTALLAAASEAEAFIDSLRRDPAGGAGGTGGLRWARSTDADAPADPTLYHGAGGVALMKLELHAALGGDDRLREAVSAGDGLIGYIDARIAAGEPLSVSPATGWPGYAFAFTELHRATGEPRFADAARRCIDRLHAQSQPLGNGIGWIEPMPFSDITGFTGDREIHDQSVGAAGAGLVLLSAHRAGVHADALGWAVQVGDRLLEVAEQDADGLRWRLMADMPFPFTAPNFAHGGAGVAYFLVQLFADTGAQRFLDAALEGARYVLSRATPMGEDGCLVCHTEEQQPPIFYLGACHGPAGTGRLFWALAQVTGERSWLEHTASLTRGLLATGAPQQRSQGLWNNHGQCCGDAGIGDFAVFMWRLTADAMYLDLAQRCAEVVVAASSLADGRRSWSQAEHRVRPRFVQEQSGYMQGAAGIASFLVHLATTLQGRPVKVVFPDVPA